MTTRETLSELIDRLVADKGLEWVEREIGYDRELIEEHLAAVARARALKAPREGDAQHPDEVTTEPLPLTDLALHLRVRDDTLYRALHRDPGAPRPVPGTDNKRWQYAEVHAWWPHRRRPGQRGPARRTADPAADGSSQGQA
ncbi:hypothetical protein [Streptomyces parvus]|uniref:hypothetical protein n=1 Tax=Streptomyces parvus TaxID=66428 RepID=UPI002101A068|nr:hypothetical protein [Streptomyces parvus]MCQ1577189.1 hypothetical protein [Streptomyces parvus]